jgi:hypothetical protein
MPKLLQRVIALLTLGTAAAATPAVAEVRAQIGNFAIDVAVSSSRGFNTNYGIVKQSTANYRVLHKGKPVTMRDADGRMVELSFWEAWTLPEAVRPAVLAANRGVYLITEENGEPRVQQLRSSCADPASSQWLDANGKVGEPYEVFIREKVEGNRELRGGTTLAISAKVVLSLKTLSPEPLDLDGNFEALKQTDGYSAHKKTVLMYSAAAQQIAMLAGNQAGTFAVGSKSNPDFAMEVVSIGSNVRYAVPFDRNALRLGDIETGATPEWAAANFEWRADGKGQQRLQQRKLAKPAPWLGRIRDPQVGASFTRDTTYILMPVHPRMAGELAQLIAREFGAKPLPKLADDQAREFRLEVGGSPISVRYHAAEYGYQSEVHVTASVPRIRTQKRGQSEMSYEPEKIQAANLQIMMIGEKIKAMLAKGALQEHFTVMPKEQ